VDFVVLIPRAGVFCLEVKGGRVACKDGAWTTTDATGTTYPLKRSPFGQAQQGMHEVRKSLEERLAHAPEFYKVPFGYAVVFTDVEAPLLEIGTEPWEVIDHGSLNTGLAGHLLRAAKHQRTRHHLHSAPAEPQPALLRTMRDALRPDFDRIVARGTVVGDSERRLLQLTEEQYHLLDILGGNSRCLFEGAAGTGKTLLALEFARRCARLGDRVLLVCFNKLLGDWFANEIRVTATGANVTAGRFYKCLRDVIVSSEIAVEFQAAEQQSHDSELFDTVYPLYGQLALEASGNRFDVIVMDEAQDLVRSPVLDLLDVWVKGGLRDGRWAFFGDFHRQAIYGNSRPEDVCGLVNARCGPYARASLKQNCRNTLRIGEETALLSGFDAPSYRMGQVEGSPGDYLDYADADSQRSTLEKVLSRLVTESGIEPSDVVILSKLRLVQSAAGKLVDSALFRIQSIDQSGPKDDRKPTFRFATAQAFKGMESKVIVLCDVDRIDSDDDRSLLYVAMSRARSLLTVLLHVRTKAAVREAFRKRMSDLWR
jgi:Type III restriction enzyme, res subunit/UvrD-like helicase C-terminal domain/Nuclease-related domain